jgi:hypothetical protein
MDELQEQLERGKQAEDFLKYTQQNGYFTNLLERVKLEYARNILSLSPVQTDEFTDYQCRRTGVDDVMNAVRGDIFLGGEALKRLNGETEEPKGLL